MRHASLFSGIGGFDLAADWMGWENVFHCDINPFGKKVLEYYYPNSISYGDITKTDFTIHRGEIDILTGGFPCQPYSHAGKRKGKEDERHLWPEMLRCIREVKPRWVVGENVLGLVNWSGGLVFHEVQSDLEAEGYEVFPYVLPACSINAPHRRDRVWFVAHSKDNGRYGGKCEQRQGIENNQREFRECKAEGRNEVWPKSKRYSSVGTFTDSECVRLEYGTKTGNIREGEGKAQSNRIGEPELTRKNEQRNDWKTFPTVSPICDGDDGISDRLDSITFSKWRKQSIMAGGNAVVPQLIYVLFKTISKFEELKTKQC